MIFRKFLIGILAAVVSINIQAQNKKTFFIGAKPYDQFYGLNLNYEAGSNGLNNSLLFKFGLGGNIDNALKEANQSRLKAKNIFGQSTDFAIYYKQENRKILGMNKMGFQGAIEWHNLVEVGFGPELFDLIFYGNSKTAGSPVDLSATHFQSLNYYQIKGGLNKISRKSKYGFNLNLNLGNNYVIADFDDTHFYTSSPGDSIALEGNIGYKYQSLNAISPFNINGIGMGIDFFYTYDNPKLFKVKAKIENLGFISWDNNSQEYQQTQPIIWEGLEVSNLLEMPNPIMEKSATDSLKEYISLHSETKKYRSYTPVNLEVKFSREIVENKIEAVLLMKYRLFSNYRPMILLQSNFMLNEQITLSPNLSFGGYSNFNIGFEFQYKLNNISELHLASRYLSGYILQNNFSGFGGFITFTYQI